MTNPNDESQNNLPPLAKEYTNLADARLGARVLAASDDFFAEMENMLDITPPVFIAGKFTPRGKWMDGWETRRRRRGGHDWAVVKLAMRGVIKGIDVDTTHFLGNAPKSISLDVAAVTDGEFPKEEDWREVLSDSAVQPGSRNFFELKDGGDWNFVRLHIYPDGGVARFRVYGEGQLDWSRFVAGELIDVAAAENGGCSVDCSDMFFGSKDNLIMPGRGVNMGDGWETKRRRGEGEDWAIIKFAVPAQIKKVIVDTAHFKGNYPDGFSLAAIRSDANNPDGDWREIIARTPLGADRRDVFIREINDSDSYFSHARLTIYPDGGVSRLCVYGVPENFGKSK